jgi:hypothetical protein
MTCSHGRARSSGAVCLGPVAINMAARALMIATLLPVTAIADARAPANGNAPAHSVIVMHGSRAQLSQGTQENGVIVMRPAPGSFMRETTRLAKESEARDEQAAREAAREADLRLNGALRAAEDAARAIERQQRTMRYYVVAPTFLRGTIVHGPGRPAQRYAPAANLRDDTPMNEISAAP